VSARRFAAAFVVLLATLMGDTRPALAQEQQPKNAAQLAQRQANFAWDKTLLRASYSFRDVLDDPIKQKLSNGITNVIAMRAFVFENGSDTPVFLAVQTCAVRFDIWLEVFRVKITSAAGEREHPVVNVTGVMRECLEAHDLPIVDRSLLKPGTSYFLGVIVDINPVSQEMLAQMRQWVQRPTGSTAIGPSSALFGAFVGLFVRNIGSSDKTLQFRTQPFAP
jgi:hypothetical protein